MKNFKQLILITFLWLSRDFNYFDDAMRFMNRLPDTQKKTAYIVALSSSRSNLISGYYAVIYGEELE